MNKMNSQEFSTLILQSHIKKNRLASSYLFTGSDEEKKLELALWFAQTLNCEINVGAALRGRPLESNLNAEGRPHRGAPTQCSCASCGKISRHTHPDVHWLGEDPKGRSLKIEEARVTLAKAALKPYEGKYKVFIFVGAERLTVDAANALLKTLEEPPPHTIFLLLVENKFHLLPTLVSRCFEIRVGSKPAVISEEARHISRVRDNRWEDYFEALQAKPRDEIQTVLTELMEELLISCRGGPAWPPFGFTGRPHRGAPALDATDAIWQCKEALEDNANQKLALSRLAMKLRGFNAGAVREPPLLQK